MFVSLCIFLIIVWSMTEALRSSFQSRALPKRYLLSLSSLRRWVARIWIGVQQRLNLGWLNFIYQVNLHVQTKFSMPRVLGPTTSMWHKFMTVFLSMFHSPLRGMATVQLETRPNSCEKVELVQAVSCLSTPVEVIFPTVICKDGTTSWRQWNRSEAQPVGVKLRIAAMYIIPQMFPVSVPPLFMHGKPWSKIKTIAHNFHSRLCLGESWVYMTKYFGNMLININWACSVAPVVKRFSIPLGPSVPIVWVINWIGHAFRERRALSVGWYLTELICPHILLHTTWSRWSSRKDLCSSVTWKVKSQKAVGLAPKLIWFTQRWLKNSTCRVLYWISFYTRSTKYRWSF